MADSVEHLRRVLDVTYGEPDHERCWVLRGEIVHFGSKPLSMRRDDQVLERRSQTDV